MEVEWLPLPGERLDNKESIQVIENLRKAYHINVSNLPIWCSFKEFNFIGGEEYIIPTLEKLSVYKKQVLLIYLEVRGEEMIEVHEASPYLIKNFFIERYPWQDKDYYIFDRSLSWCLVITHGDNLLAVNLPPIQE